MEKLSKYAIYDLVARNKRILLLGKEGFGKTHLLQSIHDEFDTACWGFGRERQYTFALLDDTIIYAMPKQNLKSSMKQHLEDNNGFIIVPNGMDLQWLINEANVDVLAQIHRDEDSKTYYSLSPVQ